MLIMQSQSASRITSRTSCEPSCSPQTAMQNISHRVRVIRCSANGKPDTHLTTPSSRRQLLAGLATGLFITSTKEVSAAPFLSSSGATGLLAEEEQHLFQLRVEKEGEARQNLETQRTKLEREARALQGGQLCATPFGIDVVGIFELLCLIGALVGGISARQRKDEVEKLNEQLRVINMSLRQQARAGIAAAPALSYAPAASRPDSDVSPGAAQQILTLGNSLARKPLVSSSPTLPYPAASASGAAVATLSPPQSGLSGTYLSMDEDLMTPDHQHCRDALRAGKRLLKEANGAAAMVRFEKALMLSKALNDQVQERRAVRGLAASARLQGQQKAAIKHLQRVLAISQSLGDYTGDADAYGTIADCYTDMGEFDQAAIFYDKYIDKMNQDGPV